MASLYSHFSQRPLYQKSLFIALCCYALFCLVIGVFAPYIALKKLPEQLTKQTGRESQIADISFNPFTFELVVERLLMAEKDPQDTFVGFEKLYANLSPWESLLNLDVSLQTIIVSKPTINLTRITQQEFNFSDILAYIEKNATPQSPTPQPEQTGLPFGIRIDKITIEQGAISVSDAVSNSHIVYPSINLEFNQFDSLAKVVKTTETVLKRVNNYKLILNDEHNSQLSLAGQVQLFPFTLDLDIALADFNLEKYWQFIDEHFDIQLNQGKLNINSHIALAIDPASDNSLQFSLSKTNIDLSGIIASHANEQKIAISAIKLNDLEINSLSKQINIGSFETRQGEIALKVSPTGADLMTLLMPKNLNASENNTAENGIEASAESESPWLVHLNKINIADYELQLGESVASENVILWQVDNINIETGAIKSDLSIPLNYQISAQINQSSLLDSSGIFDLMNQSLVADFSYQNMYLPNLQPYIEPFINITIEDGVFNTKGKLNLDNEKNLTYRGEAWVDNLNIKDNLLKQPLVSWQSMAINSLEFNRQQSQVKIDEILFDELFSRIIISEDRTTNISHLLKPSTSSTDNHAQENADLTAKQGQATEKVNLDDDVKIESANVSPSIEINRISLKNSSAFFADNSLTPNFSSGIELLNGHISQLSTNPETIASVDLAGKIDKYAPVTLKGDINPLVAQPYLDLNLIFKNVELTSVNPYSGTYAGYYIDKGQISLDLTYKLKNNALVGSNHVVIDQLQLGKPSNSDLATSLPVTLAVALLQDRHGVIDLGVDVEGDINSPSFSFGSIIWGAVGNIITKAITAPFSLLANLIGSDEPMNNVTFEFGDSVISDNQAKHLLSLTEALIDRPLLIVNVKGDIDAINDSQALAEQRLKAKLAKVLAIDISELPADLTASQFPITGPLSDALYEVYNTETGQEPELIKQTLMAEIAAKQPAEVLTDDQMTIRWHIALYNLLKNNQIIEPSDLGILAQKRAKAVKSFLVEQGKIESQRVFVMESRINAKQQAAEVQLELQAN